MCVQVHELGKRMKRVGEKMKFVVNVDVYVCVCMIVEQLFGIAPNECHNPKQKQINKKCSLKFSR